MIEFMKYDKYLNILDDELLNKICKTTIKNNIKIKINNKYNIIEYYL